jgi:hypothetical protein
MTAGKRPHREMTWRESRDPRAPILNPDLVRTLWARLAQAVDSYLAHGRRFAGLDDAALERRFVLTCRAWCKYPYDPNVAREVNDVAAEYVARHQPCPIMLLKDDLSIFLSSGAEKEEWRGLDDEPCVTIAVMLDPPLSWSVLFAPFFGAMLTPNSERYGDGWLDKPAMPSHQRQRSPELQPAAQPSSEHGVRHAKPPRQQHPPRRRDGVVEIPSIMSGSQR